MKKRSILIFLLGFMVIVFTNCDKDENNNDDEPKPDPNTFVDERDGNRYKFVEIGGQTWMAENLNYSLANGCWYYEDNEVNEDTFGRLYTWDTAQNVCPEGWHLPTDNEWKELEIFLGMSSADADTLMWRGTTQGAKLRKGSTSGFEAVYGGLRDSKPSYDGLGKTGFYWTASENLTTNAWYRMLSIDDDGVFRYSQSKAFAVSVRCLKDN